MLHFVTGLNISHIRNSIHRVETIFSYILCKPQAGLLIPAIMQNKGECFALFIGHAQTHSQLLAGQPLIVDDVACSNTLSSHQFVCIK